MADARPVAEIEEENKVLKKEIEELLVYQLNARLKKKKEKLIKIRDRDNKKSAVAPE